MSDRFTIREVKKADFNEIFNIQNSAYKDFAETKKAIESRLKLSAQTCFVACSKKKIIGYLLAHPYKINSIPAFNSVLRSIPINANSFYMHDLAIIKESRKAGIGEALINKGLNCAARLDFVRINLSAINGYAKNFYKKLGFKVKRITDKEAINNLRTYGENAEYMQLDL